MAVDGYSDDGSWPLLREHALREPRLRAMQAPPEGVYAAINRCIAEASGEYVYIATSDDVMAPDCLEKLVAALKAHPDCELAHCPLRVQGLGAEQEQAWWLGSIFARSAPGLIDRFHVRRAPLDGLLHLSGQTVYVSLTQLLIRRRLFDRIGAFEGRWGSIGDLNWGMRAGLVANTVHVPDTWAGWRIHHAQASQNAGGGTPEHSRRVEEMIDDALRRSWPALPADLRAGLESGWRNFFSAECAVQRDVSAYGSRARRAGRLLGLAATSPAARAYLMRRIRGLRLNSEVPHVAVSQWLRACGLGDCLTVE